MAIVNTSDASIISGNFSNQDKMTVPAAMLQSGVHPAMCADNMYRLQAQERHRDTGQPPTAREGDFYSQWYSPTKDTTTFSTVRSIPATIKERQNFEGKNNLTN